MIQRFFALLLGASLLGALPVSTTSFAADKKEEKKERKTREEEKADREKKKMEEEANSYLNKVRYSGKVPERIAKDKEKAKHYNPYKEELLKLVQKGKEEDLKAIEGLKPEQLEALVKNQGEIKDWTSFLTVEALGKDLLKAVADYGASAKFQKPIEDKIKEEEKADKERERERKKK